jgi:hypothetical protein
MFGQEFIRYRNVAQNDQNTTRFVPGMAMRRGDFVSC